MDLYFPSPLTRELPLTLVSLSFFSLLAFCQALCQIIPPHDFFFFFFFFVFQSCVSFLASNSDQSRKFKIDQILILFFPLEPYSLFAFSQTRLDIVVYRELE